MARLFAFFIAAVSLLPGCHYPNDARGTLDRVEQGELRVGVVDDPPWAKLVNGAGEGVEAELVKDFAKAEKAKVTWVNGSEHDLLNALESDELDLVIGGLQKGSPYEKKIGFTYPYYEADEPAPHESGQHVLAVPPGENAFLNKLETFLRENQTHTAALIAQEGKPK